MAKGSCGWTWQSGRTSQSVSSTTGARPASRADSEKAAGTVAVSVEPVGLLGLTGTTARVRGPISALISATGGTKPAPAIRSTSGSIVVGLNETSDAVLEGQRSGLRALDR